MKKTIGIILMVVASIALLLFIAAEIKLFMEGNGPKDVTGWIGYILLPAVSIGVLVLGNKLRKSN